ncbi:MAG: sialidase family protein [Kiritimatiellia bacterium]
MTDARETQTGPETVVYAVPENKRISVGAPSLLALPNGKLLAAFDQTGPDVKSLSGKHGHDAKRNRWMQGRVMCSGDGGATWQLAATYPFRRASLFRDGGDVYLLGEASGGLCLMRSPDGGASWSAPMDLTGDLDLWLAPTSVLAEGDFWLFPCLAPSGGGMGLTIWRAPRGASLMNRKAWTQGPISVPPAQTFPAAAGCGIPAGGVAPAWRDPVLAKVADPRHPWHAADAVHALGAADSGREHWAALLRVSMADWTASLQAAPDGAPWAWLPLPGGHAKFDLFYDEPSRHHWLLGSRGAPGLPLGREAGREEGLRRIGLWASDNLADWRFAGTVASGGEGPAGIRCDPSGAVCGNDLAVAFRAGGARSRNARESAQILCARVVHFRTRAG